MGQEFEFVDGTKTDRITRRFARSHAMKGKNVGKTHQRRSRLDLGRPQKGRKPTILQSSCDQEYEDRTGHSAQGCLGPADQPLIYQSLPLSLLVETTPGSLCVIKNYFTFVIEAVYPPQLYHSLDRIKSYWMQMLFIDTTSYHCTLALMATLNGFVFGSEAVSLETIHHLGKAVQLVNQKLDTAEALSNSSISVVNFLVVREIFRNEQSSAEVHLNGLRKMIELRGGLSHVEEDRTLTLKICKTDIDYALHYGSPTGFYRDCMSQAAQTMALNELGCSVDSEPRFNTMDPFLQSILQDANNVAQWFNRDDKGLGADPDALQEAIVSVGYRLVRFHPLSEPQLENKVESAYHIGLLAFITTLFLQCDGRRFLRYSLVAQCLENVIKRGLSEEDDHAKLWLLFIGGISVLTETDQSWLVLEILHVARSMGVESWEQLHQVLMQFPWISSIHDEPAKALWRTVTTSIITENS